MARRELARRHARRRRRLSLSALLLATVALAAGAFVVLGHSPSSTAPPPPTNDVLSDTPMHIHPHLAIFRDGTQATLPEDIGRNPAHWVDHTLDAYLDPQQGVGISPLHTHDTSGDIHVEAKVTRDFTLGEFFAVWGQPVGQSRTVDLVPDATHTLTMTVDGSPSDAWGDLVLADGQQIEIHYDSEG